MARIKGPRKYEYQYEYHTSTRYRYLTIWKTQTNN